MAQYIKQALVIGNDTYANGALDTCVNDAVDLTSRLRPMGFEVRCGKNLGLNSMQTSINHFIDSIQRRSIAMFFFSGHGLQHNGSNYLIPTDSQGLALSGLDTSTINVQKLIDNMYQKRPKLILVILDCCRAFVNKQMSDSRDQLNSTTHRMRDGLAPMQAPPATIIAYACAADDVSIALSRNNRNSLYTYHLLRRIGIPNMDIDLILRKVATDVQRDPLNLAHQIPFRYSSCNDIIYLAGNQPTNPSIPTGFPIPRPVQQSHRHHHHRKTDAVAVHHPQNHIDRHQINHHFYNRDPPRNGIHMTMRPVFPAPNQFNPQYRR